MTPDPATAHSRRSYLTAVAAGLGLFAGCTSEGSGTNGSATETATGLRESELPEFSVDEDAQPRPMVLDAAVMGDPESIAFLDEFAVELAVANVGGAAISDLPIEVGVERIREEDGLTRATVSEPAPVSISVSDVEPGDWTIVEAGLRVNTAGEWRVTTDAPEHPEFERRIDVAPRRLSPGQAVTSDVGGFEIAAREPSVERALHYETEEGGVGLFSEEATGLLSADGGNAFLVHRFAVTNTNAERSVGFGTVLADNQFASARLGGDPAEPVDGESMRDALSTLAIPGDATPFGDNVVAPGETAEFAAVQELPVDALAEGTASLSLDGETADVVFESLAEAPAVPTFELVDAHVDATPAGGDPVIEMTVENVGDAAGTFRGAAQFHAARPTASDWPFLPEGTALTLDPGERGTGRIPASRGEGRYRVQPFGRVIER